MSDTLMLRLVLGRKETNKIRLNKRNKSCSVCRKDKNLTKVDICA